MHGDELVFAQRAQVFKRPFDRVLHQTAYLQPELLEVVGGKLLPVFPLGHFAFWPEVRGDLRLGIMLARDQTIQSDEFHRLADRLLGMLQAARGISRVSSCFQVSLESVWTTACFERLAMLFVGAKISHLGLLPQGQAECESRVIHMVRKMDELGFGNCTNHYECEAICPAEVSTTFMALVSGLTLPSRSNHFDLFR